MIVTPRIGAALIVYLPSTPCGRNWLGLPGCSPKTLNYRQLELPDIDKFEPGHAIASPQSAGRFKKRKTNNALTGWRRLFRPNKERSRLLSVPIQVIDVKLVGASILGM